MKYYTVKQVAEILGVTQPTVRHRIKQGEYPHTRKNGKWAIPECCVAPGSTCSSEGPPAEVAGKDELTKAIEAADLAEQKAKKAKADNEREKDEREMAARKAHMTVEELLEREKVIGEFVIEISRILEDMVNRDNELKVGLPKELRPAFNEMITLVNKYLGEGNEEGDDGTIT